MNIIYGKELASVENEFICTENEFKDYLKKLPKLGLLRKFQNYH